jgi:hypothetical protein
MSDSEDVQFWERANIRPKNLSELRERVREMSLALARIQALAAEEIQAGVCTRKSAVYEIERIAREATEE